MDIGKLRELAKKATPGPWANEDEFEVITTVEQRNPGRPPFPVVCITSEPYQSVHHLPDSAAAANAEFISSANPETVLKLLDAIEEMREALMKYKGIAGNDCDKSVTKYSAAEEALHRAEEILK